MSDVAFEDQDFVLNIDLPEPPSREGKPPALSSIVNNYDREKQAARYQANKLKMKDEYHYTKIIGLRKQNGHMKLQKLRPIHERIIAAYVSGMSGVEIAAQFKCDALTVYRILGDPLAASLVAEVGDHYKDEFKQLFPLVYNAVKDGLESGSAKIQMAAVDRFQRIYRLIEGEDEGDNVVKHVQKVIDARVTIINLIKDSAPKEIIEGEIVEESELQSAPSDRSDAIDAPKAGIQLTLFSDHIEVTDSALGSD